MGKEKWKKKDEAEKAKGKFRKTSRKNQVKKLKKYDKKLMPPDKISESSNEFWGKSFSPPKIRAKGSLHPTEVLCCNSEKDGQEDLRLGGGEQKQPKQQLKESNSIERYRVWFIADGKGQNDPSDGLERGH